MKNKNLAKLAKLAKNSYLSHLFTVIVAIIISFISFISCFFINCNFAHAEINLHHKHYEADVAEKSFNLLGIKRNKFVDDEELDIPNELIIAVSDLGHKPYYYVANRILLGADIELMQYIAQKLGVQLKWKVMPFFKLEQELNSFNVDLAISMLSINEERKQKYLLSKPYAETYARFIFKDKDTHQDYLDKKYHLLFTAVVYGTSYNYYLNEKGFSIHPCKEKFQCHIYFLNQEVNSGMGETFVLKDFIEEQLDNPSNENAKNYVLSEPIFKERLVIITQKRNDGLMQVINNTIKQLDDEGVLKAISKKYFDDENVYKYFEE